MVENVELGRIQIVFADRPDAETRALLKQRGFRRAPSQNAWRRHFNANANGRAAVRWMLEHLDRQAAAE